MVDQEMAARLRWARASAGFETAADAMRVHDWTGTYNQYESGRRGFIRHVERFSRAFRVREEWLSYGRGLPRTTTKGIKVGGMIGQFGIINVSDRQEAERDGRELLEAPPGDAAEYVAYRVDGDLNFPTLFNGDVVYAGKAVDPRLAVGRQCIVTLANGVKRICILALGSAAGTFMLMSTNASPVLSAEVVEAAPVVWIRRG